MHVLDVWLLLCRTVWGKDGPRPRQSEQQSTNTAVVLCSVKIVIRLMVEF
jgi:hypothetical protein